MITPTELKQKILELVRARTPEGMRRPELRRALECRSRADQRLFRDMFDELLSEGRLVRKRGGRYVPAESLQLLSGTITVNSRGFGFVDIPERDEDVFIPPKGLNGAISGDTVLVALDSDADERGPSGTVSEIVERRHHDFVGCLDEQRGQMIVRPLRRELPRAIPVAYSRRNPLPEDVDIGDWVIAELKGNVGDERLAVAVLSKVATGETVEGDLDAVTVEFGLHEPYTAAEEQTAERIVAEEVPREDLTGILAVTIDPADAKDYDDAVSLSPGPSDGLVTLGVHIADVAAYVRPGSPLDSTAWERSFTAYLPGRTLPMLPSVLASDRCSLLEAEARPAHSVMLDVDVSDGRIVSSRRIRSTVRVSQRLSFEDAAALLSGDEPSPALASGVREAVLQMGGLAATMRDRRRREEGFLPISLPEVRVLCAERPARLVGLVRTEPTAAHDLVEEFMLAANSAVAEELLDRGIPGLFRIHAEPKDDDIQEFRAWTADVLGMSVKRLADRDKLIRFLGSLDDSPLKDVVLSAFLRVMPRAGYSESCTGHFGLGKERYAHFTSPIRRYPDLLVHQQLLNADLGRSTRSERECAEIGAHCTATETNVDSAYYAAVDRLKIRYVEQQRLSTSGLYYEATVCRLLSDGLLMYVPDLGMQGFVPAKTLSDGPFRLNRATRSFRSSRSGKNYKCGDVMTVQVRRADTVRGELSLEPLQARI